MTDDEVLEAYLDELLVQLRGRPRAIRRTLADAEAHLRDAVADGLSADDAIARFGSAREVAGAANRHDGVPLAVLVRQLVLAATLLCSVGFLAIGVSGALNAGLDAVYGPDVVAGDLPTITYTAERCAEYRDLAPDETSCAAAAARHHTDEVVVQRLATGVVGLLGLALWAVLRRRWRATPVTGALPAALVPGIGAATFGVAALALATEAMQAVGWHSTSGLGQWLTASIVSAGVAAGFGVALLHRLRHPTVA